MSELLTICYLFLSIACVTIELFKRHNGALPQSNIIYS